MTPYAISKSLTVLKRQRFVLFCLLALSVTSTSLLTIRLQNMQPKTILVPSSIADGMVVQEALDTQYMQALAPDAVFAMYTVHASTLERGRALISRLFAPTNRLALLTQYDEVVGDIVERKISTVFEPVSAERDLNRLTITVRGYLSTFLEDMRIAREERVVQVTFQRLARSVRVISIYLQEEA